MLSHLKYILFAPKIGPDMYFTHWLLFFKPLRVWFQNRKMGAIGEGSEIRPYVSIVGTKNVEIGRNVVIPEGMVIAAEPGNPLSKVIIEDSVLFGPRVSVYGMTHRFTDIHTPVKCQGNVSKITRIKTGAWVGVNCTVMPGVTIGRNSVIGANSVVTKDVPDYCVYAGAPAKLIRKLDSPL